MALTEMQTLILWALLSKTGGASFQKDMKPEVKKPDREALIAVGLITCEKRGQPGFWLEVTDKGWAWATEHLDADLPRRSTMGCLILQAWLTHLKVFMEAKGLALADILGAQPAPKPQLLDYAALRQRIRAAYLEITGNKLNTRALLRDIRAKLKDIDRATLDEALVKMQQDQEGSLYQLDNKAEITDADCGAAIYIGQEPRHILWIAR